MELGCKLLFGEKWPEEGQGRNPTDSGRSGDRLHLDVDQTGTSLGIELVGANVHDSWLVGSMFAVMIVGCLVATPEQPQNFCLDKGLRLRQSGQGGKDPGYQPHVRRIGEEDTGADRELNLSACGWVVERTLHG